VKRILRDQGLAPHAAVILRGAGFDAVHVAEIDGPLEAEVRRHRGITVRLGFAFLVRVDSR